MYIVDYRLCYTSHPALLEWYNDANWKFNTKDLKFTSGYVFTLCGSIMSWRSKKLCITRFMIESRVSYSW